jgi:hypothetical protein
LSRRIGPACVTQAPRLTDAKPSLFEEENEVLRKELARVAVSAPQECSRCGASASVSGCPPRNGQSDNARLSALEKKVEELRPSIIRAIEERFGGRRHGREARARQHSVASARTNSATQLPSLPKERRGGEWKVVELRKKGKKKEEVKKVTERAVWEPSLHDFIRDRRSGWEEDKGHAGI